MYIHILMGIPAHLALEAILLNLRLDPALSEAKVMNILNSSRVGREPNQRMQVLYIVGML